MKTILKYNSYAWLIAASIVLFARWLHPATFSIYIFPLFLLISCITAIGILNHE